MPAIRSTSLEYGESEEHLLRRLGGAVVAQWKSLPDGVRQALLAQALYVHDRVQTVQLQQQLEAFIEKHQQ